MRNTTKRVLSFIMVIALMMTLAPLSVFAAGTGTTVYLKPNSNWIKDGTWFAAYYWNGSSNNWTKLTDADGDGFFDIHNVDDDSDGIPDYLEFDEGAIERIAEVAVDLNSTSEDIGARRLHTVMEYLLEDISFNAGGDYPTFTLKIDKKYVDEHSRPEGLSDFAHNIPQGHC